MYDMKKLLKRLFDYKNSCRLVFFQLINRCSSTYYIAASSHLTTKHLSGKFSSSFFRIQETSASFLAQAERAERVGLCCVNASRAVILSPFVLLEAADQ